MADPLAGLTEAIADAVARRVREAMREPMKPMARVMSVSDAALYTAHSAGAVRSWVRSGRLRAVRIDGRVLLDRGDLDAMIESAKNG